MLSYFKKAFTNILGYLGLWDKKANLIFLGLDNAGKSTLLFLLKTGNVSQLGPSNFPTSEELKHGNVRLNTFDLGGHETARKIWKDYYPTIDGIIFLVDTTDKERFSLAKFELEQMLESPELTGVPVAILGNKIDKNGAVSQDEFVEALDLNSIMSKETRPMEVFMCSIFKKTGYTKPIEWITTFLK